jgi:phospholipase C
MGDGAATAFDCQARPRQQRERIKHVVVLTMKNRSFDHLLGYLTHDDPRYPGLKRMNASCPVDPLRPGGKRVGTVPDHAHEAVMLQPTPFLPDPAVAAAARTRLLMPGSPASQAVDEVVSYFTTPPHNDPADAQFPQDESRLR